jgi:magnesium chelatase family protein
LGILAASGQLPANRLDEYEFAGELSLTGGLRPVRGALAMTYKAHRCGRAFVLPRASAEEASLVHDARILPANTLLEVCAHLTQREDLQPYISNAAQTPQFEYPELADVKGQAHAKRALEIAAAGGHSLLMIGPPGTGKSMLAARFAGILPPMSDAEALESAALQSLGSGGFRIGQFRRRPFRAPHHSASSVALVGGGSDPRPGEISLAHHGVLFLDELPEFERKVLEMLREPLESGRVAISRAARQAEFPARFQLIAAMNPCPCGYLGHFGGKCRCTPDQVARYRGRISGPLIDRIDIHLEVPAVPQEDLLRQTAGEESGAVRARVAAAHRVQTDRQGKTNSTLSASEIGKWCAQNSAAESLLRQAIARLNLSARAYHRVLKLARTIADLAGSETIAVAHVAEAIQYRKLDRMV